MKNLLLALFIITGFTACKSNTEQSDQNRNIQLLTDSTTYNNNVFSDTNSMVKAEAIPAKIIEKPRSSVKIKTQAKRPAKIATTSPVPDQITSVPQTKTPAVADTSETTEKRPDVESKSSGSNSETATTGNETKVQKKKGLNKAAQGAIIGGVGGAVGGAIISKKKGIGAVVGGIVGAAGGYIIGKKMDKKDNQFNIE